MTAAIRLLTPADAAAYKALREQALRDAPEAFVSDYATARQRPAAEYAQRFGKPLSGTFFLGAFDVQGRMVGSVGCERSPLVKQRHNASVVAMMVAAQAQRQGMGRALLMHCLALAERVPGLEQLTLMVTASNTHAVRLYERAGFRAWGLQPRAILVNGTAYDKLHMQRLLHPATP